MTPESRDFADCDFSDFVFRRSSLKNKNVNCLFTFHGLTLKVVYLNIRDFGNDKMEIFVMICMPEELQTLFIS